MFAGDTYNSMTERRLNKQTYLYLSAILIAAFLVFSNTLNSNFIANWDDNINILENQYIKNFTADGIAALFSKSTPVTEPRFTLFTYMVQYHFSKLNPFPYHFFNIILHIINVLLVYLATEKLFKKKDAALFAAALFAVHPLHVESVAWITGRKDLLYSFFLLLSLICYLKYLSEKKYKSKISFLIIVCALSYLSVLSKVQALAIPFLLILFDYFSDRKFSTSLVAEKVMIFLLLLNIFPISVLIIFSATLFLAILLEKQDSTLVSILSKINSSIIRIVSGTILLAVLIFLIGKSVLLGCVYGMVIFAFLYEKFKLRDSLLKENATRYLFVTIALFSVIIIIIIFGTGFSSNAVSSNFFNVTDRLFMASYSLSFYIFKFFAPFDLCAIIPYPAKNNGLLPLIYYLSVIPVAASFGSVFWVLRKYKAHRKMILFSLLFFLINISFVLHLIPIAGRVIVADRYTYIAYFGLCVLVGYIISSTIQKKNNQKNLLLIILLIAFCSIAAITWKRNKVWADGISLYSDVIEKNPTYAMAYNNRGYLYYSKGNLQSAISDYDKAINVEPGFILSYYNRALAYHQAGKIHEAVNDCNAALKIDQDHHDLLYLRGYFLNKTGKYHEAIRDFNRAVSIRPGNYLAYYNRGEAKRNLSDFTGAISDYLMSAKLKPEFADAYNSMGVTNFSQGNYIESLADFQKAITQNPGISYFYYNRALSEIKLKQDDNACKDLFQAMKLGHQDGKKLYDQQCK